MVLAALVAIAAPASGQGGPSPATGRIEGIVTLLPSLSSRKPLLRLYSDYGPSALPKRDSVGTSELQNVLVYLDSIGSTQQPAGARSDRLIIRQLNETFFPHVLPVLQGSTVEFPNGDPVFHNVFSLSKARSFDLGRYARGASRAVRFDKPGIVQVFCHIHADMSAIVQVMAHPFFATPDEAGQFSIEGVPPGVYRLVGWHERVGRVVMQVHVMANQTTAVDLAVPVVDEPSSRQ